MIKFFTLTRSEIKDVQFISLLVTGVPSVYHQCFVEVDHTAVRFFLRSVGVVSSYQLRALKRGQVELAERVGVRVLVA